MKLILASNSPRRKELLGALEMEFEVRTLDGIDESFLDTHTLTEVQISFKKPAVLGDNILLKSSLADNQSIHQLLNEVGETEFARVRLGWK